MQIYKTTNLINGKLYIGKDEKNRPNYLGSGKRMKQAIIKYDRENFAKVIIDIADDRKSLCLKEIYWIKWYRDLGFELYNITDGGNGGGKQSEEANAKRRASQQGEKAHWHGTHPSDETRAKLSLAKKGKKLTKPVSAETRLKMSVARIAYLQRQKKQRSR